MTSLIVELAQRIAANTARIDEYCRSKDLTPPSFGLDAPTTTPEFSPDVEVARKAVIHDCQDLKLLMEGPRERFHSYEGASILSQHAIVRFGLAKAFPVGSEATFEEMSSKTGLNERDTRKIVRHGITQRIFAEPRTGFVIHTAASRVLAEDSQLANWVRFNTSDVCQALLHTADAMEKYPGSVEPAETGFALANNTDKPMFLFLAQEPARRARFGQAMRFFATRPGLEPKHIVQGYVWGTLPNGATIVDVGGSHGLIAMEIARHYAELNFVVQDLDIGGALPMLPPDVADRVRFQAHDFLSGDQPVKGADVYFFRAVFHNFPDQKAIKILRNLIPALKPKARIIINDVIVPAVGERDERELGNMRASDLVMSALFNASERDLDAWKRLFEGADSRFRFIRGWTPGSSRLGIVEVEWST